MIVRRSICLLTIATFMVSGGALAQNNKNNSINTNPIISPTITNRSVTNPSATANPSATSTSQGGLGGQGGRAAANPSASANPASSSGASSGSSTVAIQTGNNVVPNDQTVRSAPTVYLPSIATGNVCALGVSGGGSWIAASIGFGYSWESMQCERRQQAALLWNMNTPESRAAAKEILCNTPEIRNAYATIGSPCAADMMHVAGVPATQPPPQPIVQAVAFDATQFDKASDCLTAAKAQGAPLSLCAGKK